MSYRDRIHALLSPAEHRVFRKFTSPQRIQDYLDTLPINFEMKGETYMSPRRVIRGKTAHCFEGALVAAAALAYHGEKPLLMDFRTIPEDEDHVITLFKQNGFWGALSKTNHAILRYRDPIYSSPRELAMSYFHEYLMHDRRKSLRAYSSAYDLSKFAPQKWLTEEKELFWLVRALDDSRHYPVVPKKNVKYLRKAAPVEIRTMNIIEWPDPRLRKRFGGASSSKKKC